jgi:hypothetical protein
MRSDLGSQVLIPAIVTPRTTAAASTELPAPGRRAVTVPAVNTPGREKGCAAGRPPAGRLPPTAGGDHVPRPKPLIPILVIT